MARMDEISFNLQVRDYNLFAGEMPEVVMKTPLLVPASPNLPFTDDLPNAS